jgi:hypothetical protein
MYVLLMALALAAEGDLDRGNALLSAGDVAGAEAAFRAALSDAPADPYARAQLALALAEGGKLDEAVLELMANLAAHPGHLASTWYLGISLHKLGAHEGAAAAFLFFAGRIDASSPQWAGVHWFLVDCYSQMLSTVGISQAQGDQLIASAGYYVAASGKSAESSRVAALATYVAENRPPPNVKRWVVATTPERAASTTEGRRTIRMDSGAPFTRKEEAPEGYSWLDCDGADCRFLLPKGWFTKQVAQGSTLGVFITREEIAPPTMRFDVGVSVNRIASMSKTTGETPNGFAVTFLTEVASREGASITRIVQDGATVYVARDAVQRVAGQPNLRKRYLLVADDDDDVLYIAFVEAPEAEWDAAWKVASPVLSPEYFHVDE